MAVHGAARRCREPRLFELLAALIVFGIWMAMAFGALGWGFLAAWMLGPVLTVFPGDLPDSADGISAVCAHRFCRHVRAGRLRSWRVRSTAVRSCSRCRSLICRHPHTRLAQSSARRRLARSDRFGRPTAAGGQIAVCPPFNLDVVRFYLPPERRRDAVAMNRTCGPAPVMILSGRGLFQRKWRSPRRAIRALSRACNWSRCERAESDDADGC